MYEYFTKEEIEAKLSKAKECGAVSVEMTKGEERILVKYGADSYRKTTADEIAKILMSNDDACAVVDCDEGMMVFGSEEEKMWRC